MLLTLPAVLTADEVATMRGLLLAGPWSDGRQTAGRQAQAAKRNRQLDAASPAATQARERLLQALDRHALFYSAALPRRVLAPQFNRYDAEADRYADHVDQAIRQAPVPGGHPGAVQPLRTDLSCTVFLSDPADYDGGELVVTGPFTEQRVKLAAGDAVLYPAHTVHRVEPVTRGVRLAGFFWVQSLVRSAEQRALLLQMDLALMGLRQRLGEARGEAVPELVQLTGSYHHLLRLWSET